MDEDEDATSDTASSPLKNQGATVSAEIIAREKVGHLNTARNLGFGNDVPAVVNTKEGQVNIGEGGGAAIPPPPPGYTHPREKKRSKKIGEESSMSNDSASAASFEGDRLDQ